MYRYFIWIAFVGLNAIVLSMTIGSNSAHAQYLPDFGEFNQSREFFDQRREIIEEEIIKWLQQDAELPPIELPENSPQSQDLRNYDSIYAEAKLQPISKATANDW